MQSAICRDVRHTSRQLDIILAINIHLFLTLQYKVDETVYPPHVSPFLDYLIPHHSLVKEIVRCHGYG